MAWSRLSVLSWHSKGNHNSNSYSHPDYSHSHNERPHCPYYSHYRPTGAGYPKNRNRRMGRGIAVFADGQGESPCTPSPVVMLNCYVFCHSPSVPKWRHKGKPKYEPVPAPRPFAVAQRTPALPVSSAVQADRSW